MKRLIILPLLFLAASYPDPKLTPGDIATIDEAVVCAKGYAKASRNVTQATKNAVYEEYHAIKRKGSCCEIDHWLPLCLGGKNSMKNLWPQAWSDARKKDCVEVYLHRQVCAEKMSLKEAQGLILNHWEEIYAREHKPT